MKNGAKAINEKIAFGAVPLLLPARVLSVPLGVYRRTGNWGTTVLTCGSAGLPQQAGRQNLPPTANPAFASDQRCVASTLSRPNPGGLHDPGQSEPPPPTVTFGCRPHRWPHRGVIYLIDYSLSVSYMQIDADVAAISLTPVSNGHGGRPGGQMLEASSRLPRSAMQGYKSGDAASRASQVAKQRKSPATIAGARFRCLAERRAPAVGVLPLRAAFHFPQAATFHRLLGIGSTFVFSTCQGGKRKYQHAGNTAG